MRRIVEETWTHRVRRSLQAMQQVEIKPPPEKRDGELLFRIRKALIYLNKRLVRPYRKHGKPLAPRPTIHLCG